MAQVFDFTDYRKYLAQSLDERSRTMRGARSRLAEFLDVKPGYISQVLSGLSDLSVDQAGRANSFFCHTDEQGFYFILLVEFARSGYHETRELLGRQIKRHQKNYLNLKKTFSQQETLTGDQRNIYYSSWQFSAIFVALTVPKLQTKAALSEHFRLPPKRISEVIEFFVSIGLVKDTKGRLSLKSNSIHLAADPINMSRYHMNWRMMAIRSYESQGSNDMHYTSIVSLSEEDAFRIKRKLLEELEEVRSIVKDSKEEKVCSLLLDFFEI